jgi:S1-C subfamily serine protease
VAVGVLLLLLCYHEGTAQSVDVASLNGVFTNAAERCKRSVVSINVGINNVTRKRLKHFEEYVNRIGGNLDLDELPSGSVGSGVIVSSDGYLLTNHHVVDNIDEDSILVTLHDGRRYFGDVIGSDPSSDLALLRIYADNLEPARIAASTSVQLGELVIAIGSPLGLKFTVTSGVVSAINRDDWVDQEYSVKRYVQTDAAINPGNSGGGLFRLSGDLVGINTAILSRTGYNVGYGLALSTDLVSAVYDDLRQDGRITRPSLGVSARSESFDSSLVFDRSKVEETVIVERLKPNGAAERAGIKTGDIIRSLNGMQVRTKDNIMQYMALFRQGQRINVGLGRGGDSTSVQVDLDSMDVPFKQRDRQSTRRPFVGAGMNVDGNTCTLYSLKRHGPMYHAGLQDGDVVLTMNGTPMTSTDAVTKVIAELQPGSRISVEYERRGVRTSANLVVGTTHTKR